MEMKGIVYFLLILPVLFEFESSAAYCSYRSAPFVYMCSESQTVGKLVYINVTSASRLSDVTETTCKCEVTLYSSPSNQVWISSPGYKDCGSSIEVQPRLRTESIRYGCESKEDTYPLQSNFTVTFRKTKETFSTEYCLRIEPGGGDISSNALAVVKCFSVESTTESWKNSTLTDDGNKDKDNIVPIAVGVGVGGVVVIAVIILVSAIFCRREKRKDMLIKTTSLNDGLEMTDNALYNMHVGDPQSKTTEKDSAPEIRHVEVEGGDIYALPSKPNTSSQYQTTSQEYYSEPLGTVFDEMNCETKEDDEQRDINQAFSANNGSNMQAATSNQLCTEPETGTGDGLEPTYSDAC